MVLTSRRPRTVGNGAPNQQKHQKLLALLVAAGLAAWAWVYVGAYGSKVPGVEGAVSPAVLTDEGQSSVIAATGLKSGVNHASAVAALSTMALIDGRENARAVEDELLLRLDSGETAALVALRALHLRCRPFYEERPENRPMMAVERSEAGTAERAARQFAHDTLLRFCDRPYAPGEGMDLYQDITEALDQAFKDGDPVARAERFFEGEGERELLSLLEDTNDTWMVERALAALAQVDGPFARQVDMEVFSGRGLTRVEIASIRSSAARWYACELGAPCGGNHPELLTRCLYEADCAIGLDMRRYMRERVLTGQQYELMQRYLEALKRRLNPPAGAG